LHCTANLCLDTPAEMKSFCPGARMGEWCQLAYAVALRVQVANAGKYSKGKCK